MNRMKIILDSNVYVFYFADKSTDLIKILKNKKCRIFINDLIFSEVIRNLRKENVKDFKNLIKSPVFSVVVEITPAHIIEKYKKLELKKGDIVIAAFCEHIQADYLITENRHFLKKMEIEGCKILTAKEFIDIL